MFKRIFTPLMILLVALTSCDHIELVPEPDVESVRRTVLVYMEGRNNLSSAAIDDLNEMYAAKIPADCRLIVYRSLSGETNPRLVEIKQGKASVMIEYPADAMATDVDQMRRVIADVKKRAPSQEFGIVLWSHSSGWRQKSPMMSRGYGLEYSTKQMSVSDLAAALSDNCLDFVFFDTCYMGCVEVAYELRAVAPRMVASVCEVPTNGMPYNLTLPHLFDADIDAGLAKAIDLTVDYYTESRSTACPSTLSLIDLTRVEALADLVKPLLANEPAEDVAHQAFSTTSPYNVLFFDFGQYIESLGGDTELLNRVVMHERHTPYAIWNRLPITHCSGLSVGIPAISPQLYEKYDYYSLEWTEYLGLKP